MNLYQGDHYNMCPVRARQATTRVRKGMNYHPTGKRADYHVQESKDTSVILTAMGHYASKKIVVPANEA